jgi:hypothetical protein
LDDIRQRDLEGNTTVGRKREISNVIILAIHGTSFRALSIVSNLTPLDISANTNHYTFFSVLTFTGCPDNQVIMFLVSYIFTKQVGSSGNASNIFERWPVRISVGALAKLAGFFIIFPQFLQTSSRPVTKIRPRPPSFASFLVPYSPSFNYLALHRQRYLQRQQINYKLRWRHVSILNTLSRDSAVGIATGYGLDDGGVGVLVPIGSSIFSSPRRSDRFWGPPSLLSNGYRGSFPGGKAAGAWSWPLTSILCRGQ